LKYDFVVRNFAQKQASVGEGLLAQSFDQPFGIKEMQSFLDELELKRKKGSSYVNNNNESKIRRVFEIIEPFNSCSASLACCCVK